MGVQDETDPRIVDGLALMQAFLKIDDAADRRKVIELAAALVVPKAARLEQAMAADYLTKRDGYWHFQRRVPEDYSHLDPRGTVRHSTKIAVATDKRGRKATQIVEVMNRDLETYWRGLDEGNPQAAKQYADARRHRRNFRFD
jgi:hypothetical protein